MDFIERIFHFAPDGGNGMTEMGLILFCVLVPFFVSWLKRSGGRESDDSLFRLRAIAAIARNLGR